MQLKFFLPTKHEGEGVGNCQLSLSCLCVLLGDVFLSRGPGSVLIGHTTSVIVLLTFNLSDWILPCLIGKLKALQMGFGIGCNISAI